MAAKTRSKGLGKIDRRIWRRHSAFDGDLPVFINTKDIGFLIDLKSEGRIFSQTSRFCILKDEIFEAGFN
ncbi:hypothetical protein HC766_08945 [Candidatus Gracilibacteria bacterium]|nr:hypothetical protein [Candidatus Gracilibacteria bacterium]